MIPRPPIARRAPLGLLAAALVGCGGGAEPRWAVQHATVDVTASGLDGYQVWELFGRKWKKKQAEKHHLCGLVQQVQGSLGADFDGCPGCVASYALLVEELETDCDPAWVAGGTFDGVRGFAIGDVPGEHAGADPYPGQSLGWYLSWDGSSAEFMGFAWSEALEAGTGPVAPGWTPGERYVLEPAFAWEL